MGHAFGNTIWPAPTSTVLGQTAQMRYRCRAARDQFLRVLVTQRIQRKCALEGNSNRLAQPAPRFAQQIDASHLLPKTFLQLALEGAIELQREALTDSSRQRVT